MNCSELWHGSMLQSGLSFAIGTKLFSLDASVVFHIATEL